MKLAIFDVDGTLTDTNSVDDDCFVAALAAAHGISGVSTDWAAYPHTTDSGIIRHIFNERFGRDVDAGAVAQFTHCFVGHLEANYQRDSASFTDVPGARAAVRRLQREPGWAVAIATGCWRASALMKLRRWREIDDVSAAYAEDGLSREEILETAIARSLRQHRITHFGKIVSVGDAVWDVSAARRLNLAFIGVGSGDSATVLHDAGATHVIRDYADYGTFRRILDEADVPRDS